MAGCTEVIDSYRLEDPQNEISWIQTRFLRALSSWVLETSKDRNSTDRDSTIYLQHGSVLNYPHTDFYFLPLYPVRLIRGLANFVLLKYMVLRKQWRLFFHLECIAGHPQTFLLEKSGDHGSVWGVDSRHTAVQQRQTGRQDYVPSCCSSEGETRFCNCLFFNPKMTNGNNKTLATLKHGNTPVFPCCQELVSVHPTFSAVFSTS